MKKISELFYLKNFSFGGEIFYNFEKACFRNEWSRSRSVYICYGPLESISTFFMNGK